VRQIAVRNIGRDQPTLLITNTTTATAKDLFARHERMLIENELSASIKGFQVDALFSGLPLDVDLDTTLTVIAGNVFRLLARTPEALRARHPRDHPRAVHRHHRQHRRRGRCRHRHPHPAHLHPGPASGRLLPNWTCPFPGGTDATSGSASSDVL
jgi:hypothetical protein